jgi:hypothetical protein
LLVSGLLVQAAAVGMGFTSVGWRWPIVGAAVLVSLGTLFVVFVDSGRIDGLKSGVIGFSVGVLALALARSLSTHSSFAAFLAGAVAFQAIVMISLLLVVFFFKMNRLF